MKIVLAITMSLFILSSCELLEESGLSDSEVAEGLKTALEVGADSSVFKTSAVDGFYKNAAIKILLPPEASVIANNIGKIPGGNLLIDNLILSINRSAEDAAKSAAPILKDAVRGLTINDAVTILNGQNPAMGKKSGTAFDSTAATGYLRSTTYNDLTAAFSVPINASLDKKLVNNISTNSAWRELTSKYNQYVFWEEPINTNLGEFVTQKALNGLFTQVANEEIKIRRDPWKWVTTAVGDILTKVFGSKS